MEDEVPDRLQFASKSDDVELVESDDDFCESYVSFFHVLFICLLQFLLVFPVSNIMYVHVTYSSINLCNQYICHRDLHLVMIFA